MNSFRGAAVNSSTTLSTVTVMKYLISFTLVVTMRQQGVGPSQGSVEGRHPGHRPELTGKII